MKLEVDMTLTTIDLEDDAVADKIKKFTSIPVELLYRKAMRLTGDKLNSQYGRFRPESLPELASRSLRYMTVGSMSISLSHHSTFQWNEVMLMI